MSPVAQKMVKWPLLVTFLISIVACSGKPQPITQESANTIAKGSLTSSSKTAKSLGQKALVVAREVLGAPYRYGGTNPAGFDCSGLIQYSFNRVGVKLPRTSREIFRISQRVDLQKLQLGDLVFFAISSNKISHVGIYEGHKRFIHSPSSGKGVSYARMDNPYWQKRLVGAGRF